MFVRLSRSFILCFCLLAAAFIFIALPVMADVSSYDLSYQQANFKDDTTLAVKNTGNNNFSLIPPPQLDVSENTTATAQPSLSTPTPSTAVTITLQPSAEAESEEPLSWWLITIIVAGGLLIILVTWRIIRKAR